MAKFFELGAVVEKSVCDGAYESVYNLPGVEYVTVESGRSNDLFLERQFGEFGEAAIMTAIVSETKKDGVIRKLYELLQCDKPHGGFIFEKRQLECFKTYF